MVSYDINICYYIYSWIWYHYCICGLVELMNEVLVGFLIMEILLLAVCILVAVIKWMDCKYEEFKSVHYFFITQLMIILFCGSGMLIIYMANLCGF